MAGVAFQDQREFRCVHCSGKILVPKDLPPMTGPCPHCGSTITSPDPKDDKPPQQVSATVEVPAVATERVEVPAARPSSGPPPLPPSAAPKPSESRFAPPPTPQPVAKQEPVSPFASPSASPASPALLTPPPPLIRVEPVDLPDSLGVPDMTYHPGTPQAPAADHAAAAREAAAKEAAAREAAERELALVREAAAKEIAAAKEAAEREAAAAREAAAKEAAEREAAAREAAAKEIAAAREAAEKQAAAAREAAAKEAAAAREAAAKEALAREAAAREAAEKEAAVREAAAKDAAAREIAARQTAEKEAAAVREAAAREAAAKEAAAREAAAKEVAAAREAAAKEAAAREAAEREVAAAREAAAREAAARDAAAKEAAIREAAAKDAALKEASARAAAEREAAAAREAAAKEIAAREAAERDIAAKEAAARQSAERQAAIAREEIARATAAREALLKEATAKEAAARAAAEREVAEAREAAARQAAEREAAAKEVAAKEAAAKEAAARSAPRTVVSIGLGPESPSRPAPVAPPAEQAAIQPEVPRRAPQMPPVEVAPAGAPASASGSPQTEQQKPMAGRVSIGLSDEALNVVRPGSAPAGRVPDPVPVPAPAILSSEPEKPVLPPKQHKRANRSRKGLVMSMLFLLLLIMGGGAVGLHFIKKMADPTFAKSGAQPKLPPVARPGSSDPNAWQEEARQTLAEFLKADTPSGKAAFSIHGSELLPRMIAFYGRGPVDDSDTPLSGFAAENLPPEDHKRGIYRMTFDRPPQFELKEFFGPIAPLEVQMKVEEPDLLLSSLARVGNFTSEPVKVDVFFKRTPDGLKIDWETFVQTKYRTFRTFTELPDPGQSGVFRVFVMEDVPEKGRATIGHKTYKIIDPAYRTDSVRVEVPVDSELGRALSKVNWLGVKDARPVTKTATLELEWTTGASPRLVIKRFLCWEFLGIGGEAVPGAAPRSGR